MEFVKYAEALSLLNEQGVRERSVSEDVNSFDLEGDEVVHFLVAAEGAEVDGRNNARSTTRPREELPAIAEAMLHKLHLGQALLVPVAKWRKVFDAVAFSLASNEDWQEIDATATVEQNTRDPLLCNPADFHTVNALIAALYSDAEDRDQALVITSTATPLIVEVLPEGALSISVGAQVLADEVAELIGLD